MSRTSEREPCIQGMDMAKGTTYAKTTLIGIVGTVGGFLLLSVLLLQTTVDMPSFAVTSVTRTVASVGSREPRGPTNSRRPLSRREPRKPIPSKQIFATRTSVPTLTSRSESARSESVSEVTLSAKNRVEKDSNTIWGKLTDFVVQQIPAGLANLGLQLGLLTVFGYPLKRAFSSGEKPEDAYRKKDPEAQVYAMMTTESSPTPDSKDSSGPIPELLQDDEDSAPVADAATKLEESITRIVLGVIGVALAIGGGFVWWRYSIGDPVQFNISAQIGGLIEKIQEMGPIGIFYFSLLYVLAEVLLIPAIPLSASAGYLFGTAKGIAIVIASGTTASIISFWLGRTFLRDWVQKLTKGNPKFRAVDRTVGKEGLQLVTLFRLSLLPFGICNYLFGATAVKFSDYVLGTIVGVTPGTMGYVYFGQAGASLLGGGDAGPWWTYALAVIVFALIIRAITQLAEKALAEVEEEDRLASLAEAKRRDGDEGAIQVKSDPA